MKALIIIAVLGVIAMMSEVFRFRKLLSVITLAGFIAALATICLEWNGNHSYFSNMVYMDNYSLAFMALAIVITMLWMVMSSTYFSEKEPRGDRVALVLFTLAGGLAMISYANLTMLFIGLEILSISLYVLASSDKQDLYSNEAGMKYFLMGSFATGFLLFGIALIYGATGSFSLAMISSYLADGTGEYPMFVYGGILLIMTGLLFKVAAVPFHFWTPDVYEGSPTLITAFMATVVKTVAFAAFYKLFATCFEQVSEVWTATLAVISAITMIGGNVLAVSQQGLKRMLAYSSVSHAGYMLMAIVALNSPASVFFYVAAYSLANIGAFSVLQAMESSGNGRIENLKGSGLSSPGTGLFMSIIMLSLAGIPPLAGFFGKYFIFTSTMQAGYTWLVVAAVISSLIGVYYYFRIIYTMFQPRTATPGAIPLVSGRQKFLLCFTAIISLLLGIFPGILSTIF